MIKKMSLALSALALMALATASQALSITVSDSTTFSNTNSRLTVALNPFNNNIDAIPTLSNLALGTFNVTDSGSGDGLVGKFNPGQAADYDISLTDGTNTVIVPVKATLTTPQNVNKSGTGYNGQILYTVNSLGGSTLVTSVFGVNFIQYTTNLGSTTVNLLIRQIQRPQLPAGTETAVEGLISATAVPEPGTIALFVGMGVSGSLLALRRRARK